VVGEVVKGLGQEGPVHKPYFEVLMVTPGTPVFGDDGRNDWPGERAGPRMAIHGGSSGGTGP
jgi:hypothetical protein